MTTLDYAKLKSRFLKEFRKAIKNLDKIKSIQESAYPEDKKKRILVKDELLKFCAKFLEDYFRSVVDNEIQQSQSKIELEVGDLSRLTSLCLHLRPWLVEGAEDGKWDLVYEKKTKRQLRLKKSGSYYTPEAFARFLVINGVKMASKTKIKALKQAISGEDNSPGQLTKNKTEKIIETFTITIIDPACGNGNFLRFCIEPIEIHIRDCCKLLSQHLRQLNDGFKLPDVLKRQLPIIITSSGLKIDCSRIGRFIAENCIFGHDNNEYAAKLACILLKLHLISVYPNEDVHSMELQIQKRDSLISCFSKNKQQAENLTPDGIELLIWDIKYKELFKSGGFDVVIGNPPWEILKPNDQEFFRNYDEQFQRYPRKKQDRVKEKLLSQNPELLVRYSNYQKDITSKMDFMKQSKTYTLQKAKINGRTYSGDPQYFKLFLEIALKIVKDDGIIGFIVQHNFLGSKGCAALRKHFLHGGNFQAILEYYNKSLDRVFFRDVDLKQRFILMIYQKLGKNTQDVRYKLCNDLTDLNMKFVEHQQISIKEYVNLFPQEHQIYTFNTQQEKHAFNKMSRFQTLIDEINFLDSKFSISLSQDLHVTRDRRLIVKDQKKRTYLPVWSGQNLGIFYSKEQPCKYYSGDTSKFQRLAHADLACRNILPNSAKRLIFTMIPENTLITNACTRLSILVSDSADTEKDKNKLRLFLLALCNSLCVEFYLKIFLTGINLNYYLIEKIPIPNFQATTKKTTYLINTVIKDGQRLLNLDDDEVWSRLYTKIDSALAHLFGLSQEEYGAVLDTFNFRKLRRTKFSGRKPFKYLKKSSFIDNFTSFL